LAPTRPLKELASTMSFEYQEKERLVVYRRLGLWNGLLIGLALSVGVWGSEVASQAGLPITGRYPSLIAAALLLIAFCGLVGLITARIGKTWLSLLIWFVAAVLIVLWIGYESNWLRTLTAWLADLRFWGLPIFPIGEATPVALVLAGFAVILLLALLAILQDFRLEGVQGSLHGGRRLTGSALFKLMLPLPLVFLAGLVTFNVRGGRSMTAAPRLVHEAIQTGRTYEGDLFELGLRDGINYSAIRGVRDQMSPNYSLFMGESDTEMSSTTVVAHFDNGAWINCQLIAGHLNFCYDAAPPYTLGLSSLITGEPVPENCRNCLPAADETLLAWLEAQAEHFSGQPRITRLAQQGSHVLMRVESEESNYAIECWFGGISLIRLTSCTEAS
jgi:hypothetical protein